MDYQFRFWHSLLNPSKLAFVLDQEEYTLKGYRSRLFLIFGFTILLYILRDVWGMGTAGLTYLNAANLQEEYIISRYMSLIGAALLGLLWFLFHYYLIPFCLSILTDLSFKAISKIQIFVIASILVEKLIVFIVFTMVGYTAQTSFLSLGPISAYFIEDSFFNYFFNQLTIATAATVVIQYLFLSKWEEDSKGLLLAKIIAVQIFFALVTAGISILPLYDYFSKVVGL
ncbi:hypothetical protein D1B33_06930 [Lysinibacillus yapensis]|uniref:Yip1 domain-containing protein n=1 Tax=Ureibacillus yapensis TaxID=2304605 RepID=A0A396SIQ4_9BACL|nr:hypothetical protein [Lysinibacillus yapensis]RHW38605.1 hypothetical protein D1B33_06930 [Lysinibacillus yapensis]